ncbi:hypothetical protein, partial [Pseudomonas fragariae (ex Marin et al. 2024)]
RKETIDPDLGFWITMLFAQSLPYLAAITMAILSARANRPALPDISTGHDKRRPQVVVLL